MLSTQRFFNQNIFGEESPYENLELASLSYVDFFQDIRPQWSVLTYVD